MTGGAASPEALAERDITIVSCVSEGGTLAADVRDGLGRPPGERELPPKHLYDERGSELFDRITRLPEYYPTRCERAILNRQAPGLVEATGARELVELGSGTASKTRALLYAMAGAGAPTPPGARAGGGARRAGAGRAGVGSRLEDARAPVRHGRGGSARSLRPVRRRSERGGEVRPGADRPLPGAGRARRGGRLLARPRRGPRRRAQADRVPRQHDRQPDAGRARVVPERRAGADGPG